MTDIINNLFVNEYIISNSTNYYAVFFGIVAWIITVMFCAKKLGKLFASIQFFNIMGWIVIFIGLLSTGVSETSQYIHMKSLQNDIDYVSSVTCSKNIEDINFGQAYKMLSIDQQRQLKDFEYSDRIGTLNILRNHCNK